MHDAYVSELANLRLELVQLSDSPAKVNVENRFEERFADLAKRIGRPAAKRSVRLAIEALARQARERQATKRDEIADEKTALRESKMQFIPEVQENGVLEEIVDPNTIRFSVQSIHWFQLKFMSSQGVEKPFSIPSRNHSRFVRRATSANGKYEFRLDGDSLTRRDLGPGIDNSPPSPSLIESFRLRRWPRVALKTVIPHDDGSCEIWAGNATALRYDRNLRFKGGMKLGDRIPGLELQTLSGAAWSTDHKQVVIYDQTQVVLYDLDQNRFVRQSITMSPAETPEVVWNQSTVAVSAGTQVSILPRNLDPSVAQSFYAKTKSHLAPGNPFVARFPEDIDFGNYSGADLLSLKVSILNSETGTERNLQIPVVGGFRSDASDVAVSMDGRRLAIVYPDVSENSSRLVAFDIETGKQIAETFIPLAGTRANLLLSSDGETALVTYRDASQEWRILTFAIKPKNFEPQQPPKN